jgi:hypothetical protein
MLKLTGFYFGMKAAVKLGGIYLGFGNIKAKKPNCERLLLLTIHFLFILWSAKEKIKLLQDLQDHTEKHKDKKNIFFV